MTSIFRGNILTTAGFIDGKIEAGDDGRIVRIDGVAIDADAVRQSRSPIIVPGFIDLHVHGGGGRDVMEGGDAIATITRVHALHGTTSMLATTMTAPPEDLQRALEGLRGHAHGPGHARVLGVHLEGPYIAAGKLGAQPGFTRPASLDEVRALDAIAPVRLVTLAPELPGHLDAIRELTAAGFTVQVDHTAGTYEDGVAALQHGARSFTHLFNAMTPLHHRLPGMVGAALAHADHAEVIPDLLHVHAGAIRAALRAIPHLYCVTDSTAATGMPDGDYRLGRQAVTKCLGGVRLANGTLAGSALTMDRALRNLVGPVGLELDDACRRLSTHAADLLGLQDRGRIAVGAFADLVLLDAALQVTQVVVEGVAAGRS